MPDAGKALMSSAIDREGIGETPIIGSKYFRLVDAIPRGSASLVGWRLEFYQEWVYKGGPPRCPVCFKSNAIAFNSWKIKGDFHCCRCRVAWIDSAQALCYICATPFKTERDPHPGMFSNVVRDSDGGIQFAATCYHLNDIKHPFCSSCENILGGNIKHRRRELRYLVGLRGVDGA